MKHSIHVSIHQAYMQALRDVWFSPDFKSSPRGLPIREILDYSFTVIYPAAEPIRTLDEDRNAVIADYTAKEVALYDSCTNRVEDFAKASKFWEKIANPDGTINSAYGYLIWKNQSCGHPHFESIVNGTYSPVAGNEHLTRSPWEWCANSLKADKDTRQAVMKFSLPEHHWVGVKDFTCTLHGNWLIRGDRLNLTVVMRSNDLMKGLVYDLSWFVSLMDKMVEELRSTYPNLEKGEYTHMAHSMHIYEKDEKAVLKMLGM